MPADSNVTLRQLRYFIAAAETGQFSMAAARAHVSQSAITNAVLLLEESLGVRLFDRKPHGVGLTAEGHSFYRRTRDILDALEDALREPRFQAHHLKGAIRIGASYTVLGYFLPPLLARFRANYPDVELDLHDMNREAIEAGVAAGDIELGVVILSNVVERERFGHHVLLRSRRQLWTSAAHPLLQKDNAALADVAAYPYIQVTVDEGELSTQRYWTAKGIRPDIAFRTGSVEALRGLVAHGFGVTILSDMVYRPWSLEGKKIEARPILDVVPDMEVGLIWRHDGTLERPADAFRQFLIQACGS
ncbi:LysR family transcriptional regulator [Aromatoleum toluvorans]|uniref:LysR family transcriptional regulator n=1 Tax=Aromatoleum toluvorans TaxID=92002 RepID=A0ABX1PUP9_9RHOO|nr:LysR family transcriptional regulator [Aromatoleum toluvorans]NMG42191.1 LysR family transcriptional regulator [Aromatoleum toluvorans]